MAILVQGIGSSNAGSGGPFNPASVTYCASPDGAMPPNNPQPALRSLADGWLNYSYDKATGTYDKTNESTMDAGTNLVDRLAAEGGYVLPFSYAGCSGCANATGAIMSGTPAAPIFNVPSYTSDDVGGTNPTTNGPADLQAEIASIHQLFPTVPIVIAGHSNGGLVAEQWWLNYGQRQPDGVVQVFALDSPLNGVAVGAACATELCHLFGVGPELGAVYAALWAHQDQYDPIELAVDSKDHLFTAVGDIGDPLYDAFDWAASQHFGVKNIGLVSQMYWTEPGCATSNFDLSSHQCTVTGQAVLNPCGQNLDDGGGPSFGVPGDLWMHSLVKNCPGTINDILAWVNKSAPPKPSPTTPTATPSVQAGFTTPQAAVRGFYDGELAGNWVSACSFVDPAAQPVCNSATGGNPKATGTVSIGNAVIAGTHALVEVTGHICASPDPCVANTDPASGMPNGTADFDRTYRAVVAGSTSGATKMSPVPCIRIDTRWYINLG